MQFKLSWISSPMAATQLIALSVDTPSSHRKKSGRKRKRTTKKSSDTDDESKELKNMVNSYPQVVDLKIEVEYVPDKADVDEFYLEEFKQVFDKFNGAGKDDEPNKKRKKAEEEEKEEKAQQLKEKGKVAVISNKKKKLQNRMKLAELKQLCSRPDVVEAWDAAAPDPKLLISLKSYRNTVPVPRHWCQKRKFLQGKRGIEKKQPFKLPAFIVATGIEKLRPQEEEDCRKKLKQKQRERMRPKRGKLDIDYQVLYDAFFKFQTKPELTTYGDVYYEGREFEVRPRDVKPGRLSRVLKEALDMPDGSPPPWLIHMQTHGPPPSYPRLKIPGLNAPIVDQHGCSLYGNVFGFQQQELLNYDEESVERRKHWGDLEEEKEEEEKEEEEEEQMEEEELEADIQSVDGVETPVVIYLRKQERKDEKLAAYQILEKKEEQITPGTLLAPSHTYVLPQAKTAPKRVYLLRGQKLQGVDVTIMPEEMENMDPVLQAKYSEAREGENTSNQREDFREMVAEAERKRKRKEKESKSKKKYF